MSFTIKEAISSTCSPFAFPSQASMLPTPHEIEKQQSREELFEKELEKINSLKEELDVWQKDASRQSLERFQEQSQAKLY